MPLKPGSDKATISRNIAEFHHGQTYAHTAAKFGTATANRQAVAAAMNEAGKGGGHHPKKPKTRLARM